MPLKSVIRTVPLAFLLACAAPARALIYLPENTLESLLVRADAVVIATVRETSESANAGTLHVDQSFKGAAAGDIAVTGIMLRITLKESRPRFAAGDRVVVFLGPLADSRRAVLHAQKLETAAEIKTMAGCIAEIQPLAPVLADLGDIKKELDEKAVRAAVDKLAPSQNAYTQILLGRLMATRLAGRLKPEGSESALIQALASPHNELLHGSLAWAGKFTQLPPALRTAIQPLAKHPDPAIAKEAQALLQPK